MTDSRVQGDHGRREHEITHPRGAEVGARAPLIDYAVLRHLLDEFDTLISQRGRGSDSADNLRRLEDVRYMMCVYTGLCDPCEAAAKARSLLTRAEAGRRS